MVIQEEKDLIKDSSAVVVAAAGMRNSWHRPEVISSEGK
jgi:hypothetical protein